MTSERHLRGQARAGGAASGAGATVARSTGYPQAMAQLIRELERLPGIGPRTAERLASHLLLAAESEALALADAIRELKSRLAPCSICAAAAETDPCPICADESRAARRICVVEELRDVTAFEAAVIHDGLYHVLGGRLSPLEGKTEADLSIARLVDRVSRLLAESGEDIEVILATNPDLVGEGAAMKVAERLRALPGGRVRVSRIATGMPAGSSIEYVHQEVLRDAFRGRRPLQVDEGN